MQKILVDGLYKNNLRVAIVNNGNLEDYEFESPERQNIRGNIYLARVCRVESSLQAAFVDYGGEKNGFISFSEIHPDFLQLPKEDKEKFLRDLAIFNEKDEDEGMNGREGEAIFHSLYKSFNINEVVKKDQLLLVQVIKEERGNKGASLTTFITFPGRYFVLLPNTPRKVCISRKIKNIQERGRIREIVSSLELSQTSGIIIRTAAEGKAKEDLVRDYNYLASLWNQVLEKTVKSPAPAFIHVEENVVKKVIREYVDLSVKEVLVEGEETFNEINDFVKKTGYDKEIRITNYFGKVSLFMKFGIEDQILSLFSNKVEMPSGAYFIIQQTEALVAIDVNSGKVTSGNNVEETAVRTNLEVAGEIARQLRLRKLSGLVVIDFIDMVRVSNRILVENEIKQYLQKDKARVHVGRISQFGLLELSRQRTDQSMAESSSAVCNLCNGSGFIKSTEYISMNVLRLIASSLLNTKSKIHKHTAVYLYNTTLIHIINFKKKLIHLLEKKYNTKLLFYIDNQLKNDGFKIDFNHHNNCVLEEGMYSSNLSNIPEEVLISPRLHESKIPFWKGFVKTLYKKFY